jgi:hypothetical protein
MTRKTASTQKARSALFVVAALPVYFIALAGAAQATDLLYTLQSPSFGGTNSAPFTSAQFEQSLRAQRVANQAAAAAAAAKAGTTVDPNAAFVSAITSQLTGLVAQSIAQKIANSQNGQSGTIQSGGVVITYINSDGQLSVTITSPAGSTTLSIPVAN